MLVKNFRGQKPISGMKSTPKDTVFNVYTEIKNKRQELDGLIDSLDQYTERNNTLYIEIVTRTNELKELDNLIDLAHEQLEAIITKINYEQLQNKQMLLDTNDQEEKLQKLLLVIKDRVKEADQLQQILTNLKNKQIEFELLQEQTISKERSLVNLNNELISKQALIETFDRQYAAKLHRTVILKEKRKFNQVG
jgi:predicted  nucleic acid-binding Zn-ribbon protein